MAHEETTEYPVRVCIIVLTSYLLLENSLPRIGSPSDIFYPRTGWHSGCFGETWES